MGKNWRKKGDTYYIVDYYYETIPDPKDKTKQKRVRRQKSFAVTKDKAAFDEYRDNYFYAKRQKRLSLPNRRHTWDRFSPEFFLHLANEKRRLSTANRYRDAFNAFQRITKPDALAEIGISEVRAWKATRTAEIAPATFNADLRHMRAAWQWAIKEGYAEVNPFKGVDFIKIAKKDKKQRAFLPKEVEKLLDAAEKWEPEYWLMVMVFRYAGLRLEELTHQRTVDVDMGTNWISITAHPCPCGECAKNGGEFVLKDYDERKVPLDPVLKKALRKYPRNDEMLFPGLNGGVRSSRSVEKMFDKLLRKARIEKEDGMGPHTLRHTFITECLKDAPPTTVQRWAGHSKIETTMLYSHVDDDHSQDVMLRMAKNRA